MRRCHAADHAKSKKHLRNLAKADKKKGQQAPFVLRSLEGFWSTPSMLQDEPSEEPFQIYDEVEGNLPGLSYSDEMERNPPLLPCSDEMKRNLSVPFQSNSTTEASGCRAAPLSQLWEEFQAERTVFLDDYFEEIQRKIDNGELLFSSSLPPLEEELQLKDEGEDLPVPSIEALFADYGIDVDGMELCQYQFPVLNVV